MKPELDLPKENTSKSIAASLEILSSKSKPYNPLKFSSYKELAKLASSGKASKILSVGDEIPVKFTSTDGKEYDMPFVVNHFCDEENMLGKNIHGVWAMSKYCLPAVPFSGYRAFYVASDGLASGTYHVTFGADFGNIKKGDSYQFTLTKSILSGGKLFGFFHLNEGTNSSRYEVHSYDQDGKTLLETVTAVPGTDGTDLGTMQLTNRTGDLNCVEECCAGLNNWTKSAIRQWLNSDKPKGEWWSPQDQWDIAPDQVATIDGFLKGVPKEFVDCFTPVKVITTCNGTTEVLSAEVTYDKVILPSKTNMFISAQTPEGVPFDYWKLVNGTSTRWPEYTNISALKHYKIEDHNSSIGVRTRSVYTDTIHNLYSINPDGFVYHDGGYCQTRCTPLAFISII